MMAFGNKNSICKKIILLAWVLLVPFIARGDAVGKLTDRESIRLVITDSGMGGLSVMAEMARLAKETRAYKNVDLIFVNALFDSKLGYNSILDRPRKVQVFNSALSSMRERYQPDGIFVACNTLSVILLDCEMSKNVDVPIVGIVDTGVDLIGEELTKNPEATAIIFATQTTIEEDTHRKALLKRGISEDRIVVEPCPELAWYIEQDPAGFDTELLVSSFVSSAKEKMKRPESPIAVSLNCTHYGYSRTIWEKEIESQGGKLQAILNPNDRMASSLFPDAIRNRFPESTVTVRTFSMVEIPEVTVDALAPVLEKTSPEAAESLRNWERVPELFAWKQYMEAKAE